MAAYGFVDDVLARAGRISGYFTAPGNRPNLDDIQGFLDQLSDLIDDAIRANGFDPASVDEESRSALADLAAYGAVARAVRGTGDRSPEVQQILVQADAVWLAAMGDPTSRQPDAIQGSIRRGDHPVIRALEAAAAGGGSVRSAGTFWGDEPNYGRPEKAIQEYLNLWGTNLAPGFSRGQHL